MNHRHRTLLWIWLMQANISVHALLIDASVSAWLLLLTQSQLACGFFPGSPFRISEAFAARTQKGGLIAWGHPHYGGSIPAALISELSDGVQTVFSSSYAFAALKANGNVACWGMFMHPEKLALTPPDLGSVLTIRTTRHAMAALKADGSVTVWGSPLFGGDASSPNDVTNDLKGGVRAIFANSWAFAALKRSGSVVTWGEPRNGGSPISGGGDVSTELHDIRIIVSSNRAFAAIKNDGRVITWGSSEHGGLLREGSSLAEPHVMKAESISSTCCAFAAVCIDGSVDVWGNRAFGGKSEAFLKISSELAHGAHRLFSTAYAFAALMRDGRIVTWGWPFSEGTTFPARSIGVVHDVFSTKGAFAALNKDGGIFTFGDSQHGGAQVAFESRRLAHKSTLAYDKSQLPNVSGLLRNGVLQVSSTESAFAAHKADGSVVVWGDARCGGLKVGLTWGGVYNFTLLLSSGVVSIYSTSSAFAARRRDNSIVTWGDNEGDKDVWQYSQCTNNNTDVAAVYGQRLTSAPLRETFFETDVSAGKRDRTSRTKRTVLFSSRKVVFIVCFTLVCVLICTSLAIRCLSHRLKHATWTPVPEESETVPVVLGSMAEPADNACECQP